MLPNAVRVGVIKCGGSSLAMVSLAACSAGADVDSDGDGLTDREEAELGTDPLVADTDKDGLTDGEEVALGTNPLVADTDGDSYLDGWEVREGTDPLDPTSVIYTGGWSYNPTKDLLEQADYGGSFRVGSMVPRHIAPDQFRDQFDLYDAIGQGVPVIIDWSALWCGPCHEMSGWLDGDNVSFYRPYNAVRDAIDDGRVIWVTVLVEAGGGGRARMRDAESWFDLYPHPRVPVVIDVDRQFSAWSGSSYFPTLALIGADGRVLARNNENVRFVLSAALGQLDD